MLGLYIVGMYDKYGEDLVLKTNPLETLTYGALAKITLKTVKWKSIIL